MSKKPKSPDHFGTGVITIEELTPKATRAHDAAALDRLIAAKALWLKKRIKHVTNQA